MRTRRSRHQELPSHLAGFVLSPIGGGADGKLVLLWFCTFWLPHHRGAAACHEFL